MLLTIQKSSLLTCRRYKSAFAKAWFKKDVDYCIDLVKKHDYESYLTTLLLPEKAKIPIFGLRALNVEIAKVPDSVTEKNTGKTRLIFWGNCIKSANEGKPPKTPTASLLSKILTRYKLPEERLIDLVMAREIYFLNELPKSIEDIEKYAEKTNVNLLELSLQILGTSNKDTVKMANHVGKVQGLTTMLRAIPFHASRGKIFLPTDLIKKYQVTEREIAKGKLTDNGRNLVSDVTDRINEHLKEARSIKHNCDTTSIHAMLPAVLCDTYIKNLKKHKQDIFHPSLYKKTAWLPLKLLICKQFKTF